MGLYINTGNAGFQSVRNGEYVDKSGQIALINGTLDTERRYSCMFSWLRRMFKDVSGNFVFSAVYMTGILPVKKYKTESALNNFIEYSMVEPVDMASYFGFTKDEVKLLAEKHHSDYDELVNAVRNSNLVLIPRKHVDSPAIVLELKYNQDADTAILRLGARNILPRFRNTQTTCCWLALTTTARKNSTSAALSI